MATLVDESTQIRARKAGFINEVAAVARRALRSTKRDPESVIPALIIPVFFFVANVGALQDLAETLPGLDYKAFQLPVAIIFAVTGISPRRHPRHRYPVRLFRPPLPDPRQSARHALRPHGRRFRPCRRTHHTRHRPRFRRRRPL